MTQKHKHAHKEDTVRLTIDFPADQHTYLKMLAAKDGVSMRQYVIEHLPSLHKKSMLMFQTMHLMMHSRKCSSKKPPFSNDCRSDDPVSNPQPSPENA